jgi:two-component system response regulator FlrC
MLEATLFGHERGAFTGAVGAAKGLFRAAHGGTLFLDEVSEIPLALQAKLLRAVQEREVLPIGATRPERIDVRLVTAANRDLAAEVSAGRFRADLFYRLAVFPLRTLPLAQRPEDIIAITAHWLLKAGSGRVSWPTPAALARLQAHDWPGNVRELGNVLDRALVLAEADHIEPAHIVFDRLPEMNAGIAPLPGQVRHHEARVIRDALASSRSRRAAAERLGISERTLRYKIAAMGGARGTVQ